jgi:hypothetical protein
VNGGVPRRSSRPQRATGGWWRSHSVRVRLTLWNIAAMLIVLGVYVFAVNRVVTRSVREALDEELRREFPWVAASIYRTPQGEFMLQEHELIDPAEDLPWVQVWSADGKELLFRSEEAQRRRVPESQTVPTTEGIASIATETRRCAC